MRATTPRVAASYSYPNHGGWKGDVCVYTCPFCGVGHTTLLRSGEDMVIATPPCGEPRRPKAVEVTAAPESRRLHAAPVEEWAAQFEAERKRANGGRPKKTAQAVRHVVV